MTRIIDWKVLKTIIPYSRQHIKRLEDEGKFPLRISLGEHRVGWVVDEVEGWIQNRLRKREHTP
jgi:prophage regulatory protein